MIPYDYVTEWEPHAPWQSRHQIEHDLIISRALLELYTHERITENLAFRGGTALFKLYLPATRYSEDIDLVQVSASPIGPVMDAVQEKLNPWLGSPKRKRSDARVLLAYRFESEDGVPLRLKIEINSREHFCMLGYVRRTYKVASRWFSGSANVLTYRLEELLGTKLRALYQRRKGRDLYDLWRACSSLSPDVQQIAACFQGYIEHDGLRISRTEFEHNFSEKLLDRRFLDDIAPLLAGDENWNVAAAADFVMTGLLPLLP